jgi:hypothetical protein
MPLPEASPISAADFAESKWGWSADIVLPAWAGFHQRAGAYASQSADSPSNGTARLMVMREGCAIAPVNDSDLFPTRWVIEHQHAVRDALLAHLRVEYARRRPRYERFLGKEFTSLMPEVHSVDEFRNLLGLNSVYIHPPMEEGRPFAGFLFGCSWDSEHGLGALMHGTSVVELGGADTAFNFWHPAETRKT